MFPRFSAVRLCPNSFSPAARTTSNPQRRKWLAGHFITGEAHSFSIYAVDFRFPQVFFKMSTFHVQPEITALTNGTGRTCHKLNETIRTARLSPRANLTFSPSSSAVGRLQFATATATLAACSLNELSPPPHSPPFILSSPLRAFPAESSPKGPHPAPIEKGFSAFTNFSFVSDAHGFSLSASLSLHFLSFFHCPLLPIFSVAHLLAAS